MRTCHGAARAGDANESPRARRARSCSASSAPRCSSCSPASCRAWCSTSGFDDRAAGYVASAEMFGIAATTVAMTFAAHRFNWRASWRGPRCSWSSPTLACTPGARRRRRSPALRFAAGLGAGGLISLTFTAIGLTRNPTAISAT